MKEMNAEHQDGYGYGDPSALECMYDTSRDEKEEKEEKTSDVATTITKSITRIPVLI